MRLQDRWRHAPALHSKAGASQVHAWLLYQHEVTVGLDSRQPLFSTIGLSKQPLCFAGQCRPLSMSSGCRHSSGPPKTSSGLLWKESKPLQPPG